MKTKDGSKISHAKVRRYVFEHKPKKPNPILGWALRGIAAKRLRKTNHKIKKHGMDSLSPPYLVLASHMSALDLVTMLQCLRSDTVNFAVSFEEIREHYFLMRNTGCIVKRRFVHSEEFLSNIEYALKTLKNTVVLFPEERLSLAGTQSPIPDSLGGFVKRLGVPVVAAVLHGNYLRKPDWSKIIKENVPLSTEMSQIITQEDVDALTESELQKRIEESLRYDEFRWQYDNRVIIDHPGRAKNLHKILYQCPSCNAEHEMYSFKNTLKCTYCGKQWNMDEFGRLFAAKGITEFEHIPDWFEWQRQNIIKEIQSGSYYFEDEVLIETLPAKSFYAQGKGVFKHTMDGFELSCTAYGEPRTIVWDSSCIDINVEFDYKRGGDAFILSAHDESYWIYPLGKRNPLTKVSLAAQEIHKIKLRQAQESTALVAATELKNDE